MKSKLLSPYGLVNLDSPQAHGLVGFWPLDDAQGLKARDLSAKRNPGDLLSGTTWKSELGHNSASFDGTNDHIEIPPNTIYDNTNASWSFWFKDIGSPSYDISLVIRANASGHLKGFIVTLSATGTLTVAIRDVSTTPVGSLNIPLVDIGKWHHVCLNLAASGTFKVYVDGIVYSASVGAWSFSATTTPIRLARATSSVPAFLKGYISDLRVYSYNLSESEVNSLYYQPERIYLPQRSRTWFSSSAAAIDLASSTQSIAAATGTLTAAVPITGAAAAIATATGVINSAIDMAGSAAAITIANGVATINLTLTGEALAAALATGQISATQTLSGNTLASADATGQITSTLPLAGSAQAQAGASGAINLTTTLAGSALAAALATANLDAGDSGLSGDAQGMATASWALFASIPVSGSAPATVTASGGLSQTQALTGVAVTVATGTGDVTIGTSGLSGEALAAALAGGTVTMSVSMSAAALARAIAGATLTVPQDYTLPIGAYSIRSLTQHYSMRSLTRVH